MNGTYILWAIRNHRVRRLNTHTHTHTHLNGGSKNN